MRLRTQIWTAVLGGSLLSLGMALLLPAGNFLTAWLGGSLLAGAVLFGLLAAWKFGISTSASAGQARRLAWLIGLAFVLRFGVGIFLTLALPAWGNDQPAHDAGYIYSDPFVRDQLAWQMAVEGQPLAATFQQSTADQYGGLLALSTLVYRLLSPDTQRTWLILLLAAFGAAVGVLFLWRGLRQRFGDWVASAAAWIFVLYPESVLLGGSQMREPFLIGLSGIAFWAVLDTSLAWRRRGLVLGIVLGAMLLFSPPAGLLAGLFIGGWLVLERLTLQGKTRWLILALMLLGGAAFLVVLWNWFWLAAGWDSYLTERGSGWIQLLSRTLDPLVFRTFLAGYGLVQPVLPATLFDPALPMMKIIAVLRSLGWYVLAPFLVYGIFASWKAETGPTRRALIWTAVITLAWVLISSLRAGGDMWDNPRYRTLAIPWMALLAAWGWQYARQSSSPWLKRTWIVTGIFVAGFTYWYMGRFIPGIGLTHVLVILGVVAAACLVFLGGSWLWDRRQAAKTRHKPR